MAKRTKIEEHFTPCPMNPTWVAKMLSVLPEGSQGKLAKYKKCPNVEAELERIRKAMGGE